MTLNLLLDHFDTIADSPGGVARLRALILQLAVRGKLVPQDPADEPAGVLLAKRRTTNDGGRRNNGTLPPLTAADMPFALPSGWEWTRLADVGHEWGHKKPDAPFTYIDVSAIDKERGVISDNVTVLQPEDAPSRARKLVREGTVIYSTVRPYLLNIAVVDHEFKPEPIVSTAFAVIHPYAGIENRYLYYYLRSQPFVEYVESQMKGMAYPAINDGQLFAGLVPLPPTAEQRRIVARVDALLALCDALEARQTQQRSERQRLQRVLLAALTAASDAEAVAVAWQRVAASFDVLYDTPDSIAPLRQAVLQLAVQGRLVPQDPDDEPAGVLLERIQQEKAQRNDNGTQRHAERSEASPGGTMKHDETPFALPSGWEWERLGNVADLCLGKMLDQHKNKGEYLPYLRNVNVRWFGFDLSNLLEMRFEADELERFGVVPGDVLVCEGGEPGRGAIWDGQVPTMQFQKAIHRVRPSEALYNRFFMYALYLSAKSGSLERYFTGMTIKHLTGQKLASYVLPLPPLAEQRRIVARVDEFMALCDALEAGLRDESAAAERLAAALAHGVIGG